MNWEMIGFSGPLIALVALVGAVVAVLLVVAVAMFLSWLEALVEDRRERRTRKDVCPDCEGYRYKAANIVRGLDMATEPPTTVALRVDPNTLNVYVLSTDDSYLYCPTCGGTGEIPAHDRHPLTSNRSIVS